ncbi:hypothetical protein G5I_07281 [Acromyrmex echinatior]|uniref:Uncharacterized protein n=1 Tax=Acromyrmex echinatior TaxID=103372 RepID=F4WNC6_ACREC|nr:hypothetical protein G5I_07281 [Acromyrmex echinatior]
MPSVQSFSNTCPLQIAIVTRKEKREKENSERKSDPPSCACVDTAEVYLPRRNMRVQKGDAEKCACGANGGECNATRTEPAAECSFEPNSEPLQSRLSATVRRNKNEEKKKEGKRCAAKNGPRCEPPGALYHHGCERDVEAHRVGDTIHLLTVILSLERCKKYQLQANFFLQENGNAHSTQPLDVPHETFTRAAYSSEASRADPELVPGVNTCTLNNREFLAIIERRAGPGRFRCAFTLLVSPHYVTSPARAASCNVNSGVQPHGRVQFVHGAESGVRSVIEPFGILFRRHESRGAAAFPRNYCLPVNSRIFRQPMQGVSELESYREAVSRRSGMELCGKQRC